MGVPENVDLRSRSGGWSTIELWLGADPRLTRRHVFVTVLAITALVFSLTANWTYAHNDPLSNALTGWYLGNEGSVALDQHADLVQYDNRIAWVRDSPVGPVSQYAPGAALLAGVAYAAAPDDAMRRVDRYVSFFGRDVSYPEPPLWPAVLSAVLATAVACAVLAVTFHDLGAPPVRAVGAGVLVGVSTGAWSVASNMSWTHGPGMMAVAMGTWAAARDRWWWSGAALGYGVLVRPHLALVAAAIGVGVSIARRDVRPAIGVGIPSALGLAALLAYNWWVWGTVTISGGYGGGFADRLTEPDPFFFLRNVVLGLVSPVNGVLVWAPFLLVLVPAAWFARRHQPDWAVFAAVGGCLYLLVQWKANRYSGGNDFFAYRYPLETLVAIAPALYVGWDRWVRGRATVERVLRILFLVAIVGQGVGAVLS